MDQIRVSGKIHFYFRLKARLVEKLKQGAEVFSDSENSFTVYTDPLEIPLDKITLKDQETILIPPMELVIRAKLTIKREKGKGSRRKR